MVAGVEAAGQDASLEAAALFREHYPSLVRVALAMTADPSGAEDLAQEAFVRAYPALGRTSDPGAYLRTCVINLVRRNVRRRVASRLSMLRPNIATHDDPAVRIAVIRAMQALPPRQRACVALRYFEDLSESRTAQVLGVSVGTVKSQTYKALKRLRGLLGDEE